MGQSLTFSKFVLYIIWKLRDLQNKILFFLLIDQKLRIEYRSSSSNNNSIIT